VIRPWRALPALAAALVLLPRLARAEPDVDARLRTQITATTALDAAVSETDLDLDTTLDAGLSGLLRPELSGSLAFRDRRDLNEPPAGSALRDAWDVRPDRSQERFERGWLEFGDRLALRVGRQVDWAGAFVRYDGASVRLRRVPGIPQAVVFGGRRVALDATDDLANATRYLVDHEATGTFHATGPDFIDRGAFAIQACARFGVDPAAVMLRPTSELQQAAPRPLRVLLDCGRLRRAGVPPFRGIADGLWSLAAQAGSV
jgi:hypothetical protein